MGNNPSHLSSNPLPLGMNSPSFKKDTNFGKDMYLVIVVLIGCTQIQLAQVGHSPLFSALSPGFQAPAWEPAWLQSSALLKSRQSWR
jgi:hypothetical protein